MAPEIPAEISLVSALEAAEYFLQEGKPVSFVNISATNSMWPTIKTGDTVFLFPEPWENISRHDIIGYKNPAQVLIIHRIMKKKGDAFIAQGDNNAHPDPLVKKEAYRGVVRKVRGPGGKEAALSFGWRGRCRHLLNKLRLF